MVRFSARVEAGSCLYSAGNFTFPDFSQGDDYEPSGVYQVRKEDPAFADDFTKVVGSHTLKFEPLHRTPPTTRAAVSR